MSENNLFSLKLTYTFFYAISKLLKTNPKLTFLQDRRFADLSNTLKNVQTEIVNKHNDLRRGVSPPPSNMLKMVRSRHIQKVAWAGCGKSWHLVNYISLEPFSFGSSGSALLFHLSCVMDREEILLLNSTYYFLLKNHTSSFYILFTRIV